MIIIILHLPVKSLLKCKCICKYWQSIASDPQFCHQHASLRGPNPSPSALLFQRSFDIISDFEFCFLSGNNFSNNSTRIVSFDYLNPPGNGLLSLLSSCNGLLLFQFSNLSDPRIFYVCNPTTKKFTTLALPNYLTALRHVDAYLAFDPCVSPHYKVVFLWTETKTCGKLSDPFPSNAVRALEGRGIFCNGKICWHGKDGDTSFSLDVEQGCLNVFKLPLSYNRCLNVCCFGASRCRLYLVVIDYHLHRKDNTYVYELNEGCSGWVLKYELGFCIHNLMLSDVSEEQDEGSTLLQLGESNQIVAYNLKEKTTNKVCDLNPLCNERGPDNVGFNRRFFDYKWCAGECQWIETLSCF